MNDYQINYNCFNEPFAVSPCRSLYWDMHGLIFETSIWLLAGSTRFLQNHWSKHTVQKHNAWHNGTPPKAFQSINDTSKLQRFTFTLTTWHCRTNTWNAQVIKSDVFTQSLHAQHAWTFERECKTSTNTHKRKTKAICIHKLSWLPHCQPQLNASWLTRHIQQFYQQDIYNKATHSQNS